MSNNVVWYDKIFHCKLISRRGKRASCGQIENNCRLLLKKNISFYERTKYSDRDRKTDHICVEISGDLHE